MEQNKNQPVLTRPFIVKSILTGIISAIATVLCCAAVLYCTYGAVPDLRYIVEQTANVLFGIQLAAWIALLPGNAYSLFMLFFTNFFGGKPRPIVREIDGEADLQAQTERYRQNDMTRKKYLRLLSFVNIGLFTFAVTLLCVVFIAGVL